MPETATEQALENLIAHHRLPPEYRQTLNNIIEPLALSLHQASRHGKGPLLVGIHGAQGTGKSTLTDFLRTLLAHRYQCPTASLSLDDIYHTRATRERLASEVHPLLLTRGVPGTHDLELGNRILEELSEANAGSRTPLPAFDKALDDREPEQRWPVFIGKPQIILLEGWCLGARPQPDDELLKPVNDLEAEEDPDGSWRRFVNEQLRGPYREFFDRLHFLIMLRAPSMERVLEWRTLQEHRLAESRANAPKAGADQGDAAPQQRIMTDADIARFVMHYERITRHCLQEMPERADIVLNLDDNHRMTRE